MACTDGGAVCRLPSRRLGTYAAALRSLTHGTRVRSRLRIGVAYTKSSTCDQPKYGGNPSWWLGAAGAHAKGHVHAARRCACGPLSAARRSARAHSGIAERVADGGARTPVQRHSVSPSPFSLTPTFRAVRSASTVLESVTDRAAPASVAARVDGTTESAATECTVTWSTAGSRLRATSGRGRLFRARAYATGVIVPSKSRKHQSALPMRISTGQFRVDSSIRLIDSFDSRGMQLFSLHAGQRAR
jgi:hypothetical protein